MRILLDKDKQVSRDEQRETIVSDKNEQKGRGEQRICCPLDPCLSLSERLDKGILLLFETLFIFVLKTWQGTFVALETLFIFVLKT